MLTENEARDLLRKAGQTIAVDPAAPPIAVPPTRRWRAAAAAVAVAATLSAIAGTGTWLAGRDDGSDDTGTTTVLGGVPDGAIPSVFAHTRASATEMLEDLGLNVRFRDEISCYPEGRPLGTSPSTGTRFDPGDTVTVLLAYQAANTDCVADLTEPWAFMDFATGRGPAPRFATEVGLFVDGQRTRTLTGAAAESGEWGTPSALTELRTASEQVIGVNGHFTTPTLDVQTGTPPDQFCVIPQPAVLGGREALTLTVDIPVDGQFHCPSRVSIYQTAGQIDAVVTWTERPLGSGPDARPIPDVVGMKVAQARAAVTAAGHTARVEELETCHPRSGVVEQAPTQQDIEDDFPDDQVWSGGVTLVVEVPHTSRDCAALDAAAQGFIRFARGGAPPLWATEVEQLLGYTSFDRVTAERADDPAAWSLCSGVAPADCKLSPLVVIADSAQVVADEQRDSYECEFIDFGGLPTEVLSEEEIHLFPTGVVGCAKQWDISLWIDDAGRIMAVNLLVPE